MRQFISAPETCSFSVAVESRNTLGFMSAVDLLGRGAKNLGKFAGSRNSGTDFRIALHGRRMGFAACCFGSPWRMWIGLCKSIVAAIIRECRVRFVTEWEYQNGAIAPVRRRWAGIEWTTVLMTTVVERDSEKS